MLHIEISKALKRKFDSLSGKEIDPNYGKDKKVSTGYLMSSYSKFFFFTFSRTVLFIVATQSEVCTIVCLLIQRRYR